MILERQAKINSQNATGGYSQNYKPQQLKSNNNNLPSTQPSDLIPLSSQSAGMSTEKKSGSSANDVVITSNVIVPPKSDAAKEKGQKLLQLMSRKTPSSTSDEGKVMMSSIISLYKLVNNLVQDEILNIY